MDEIRDSIDELELMRLISTNLEKQMYMDGFDMNRTILTALISLKEWQLSRFPSYQSLLTTEEKVYGSIGEGLFYPTNIRCERDMDTVYIFKNIVAVENALDIIQHNTETLRCLIVNDQSTPGYCYLRVINEDSAFRFPFGFISSSTMKKMTHMVLRINDTPTLFLRTLPIVFANTDIGELGQRGPASNFHVTFPMQPQGRFYGVTKYDIVHVIPCPNWPSAAYEWVSRARTYGWPTDIQIKEIVDQGIYFAPVGCKEHLLESWQWRYSFNEGERRLVRSFNSTQAKCYVLLKRTISENVTVQFKEDVISSYHLKTLMFWTIEETDTIVWIPANLVQCIFLVLNRLLQCAERLYCPSYFIPDENLFINKVTVKNKRQLIAILKSIIAEGWLVLTRLSNFAMDQNFIDNLRREHDTEAYTKIQECVNSCNIVQHCVRVAQTMIIHSYLSEADVHEIHEADRIHSTFGKIINTLILDVYSCEDTQRKEMLKNVLASIGSSYGTHILSLSRHLIVDMIEIGNMEALGEIYIDISCWNNQVDCLAKHANYTYMRGNLQSTFSTAYILLQRYFGRPVNVLTPFVRGDVQFPAVINSVTAFLEQSDMTATGSKILMESITSCREVTFMRNEIHAVPDNVKVEMLLAGTIRCPVDCLKGLRQCLVVDSYFYVTYLAFLAFCDMELPEEADKVLQTMEIICNEAPNSHWPVSLNLLGDCYLKRRKLEKAMEKFALSMKRNSKRNAAPWHVARLVWRKLLDTWFQTRDEDV